MSPPALKVERTRGDTAASPEERVLVIWAHEHGREFPWRNEQDPYSLIVTELMLIRTRAEQVGRLWASFFAVYPTLESLANADHRDVQAAVSPLGLSWRALLIIEFARAAASTPNWLDELESLPGAGPYVVAATMIGVAGRGHLPVDVTIARVLARYFGFDIRGEARRDRAVLEAARLIGPVSRQGFHAWLDLAATICTPVDPACSACPLRARCRFSDGQAARGSNIRESLHRSSP